MGLTIHDWVALLGGAVKQDKPESYWCLCPCHSDHEPSLHVFVGDRRKTILKCFVCNAGGVEIAAALGRDKRELMSDAYTGEIEPMPERETKKKAKKPMQPFRAGEAYWRDESYTCAAVYEYQTADGKVVLRKARYEQRDDEGVRTDKTFMIQSLGTDGKWYGGAGIYNGLCYQLPDVVEAVKTGKRILIAEGEKDVDNLRSLGYVATSGMHGAGKNKLEGKWNDDNAKWFDGAAEVVLIPDNDGAGETLMRWIGTSLTGKARCIRILRLSDVDPELPKKGDFTDWVKRIGEARGSKYKKRELTELVDQLLDDAPIWTRENYKKFEGDDDGQKKTAQQAEEAESEYPSYYGSGKYCVKDGRLAVRKKTAEYDGAQALCSFVPEPVAIVLRDDGDSVKSYFSIRGKNWRGGELAETLVSAEEMASQRGAWSVRAWNRWGAIEPMPRNAAQLVNDAICKAAQLLCEDRLIYLHSGFRRIGGRWCYLYEGGAIGADNVGVELEGKLSDYDLSDTGVSTEDATSAEVMLLDALPHRIILPLMGMAYLAPLYSLLEEMQSPVAFSLFLCGESNSGKSSVAAWAQAHFGRRFYRKNLPGNLVGTINSLRNALYYAKDTLFVIDDYTPAQGPDGKNPKDRIVQEIIGAIGDRQDRGRLGSDLKAERDKPSRVCAVMTGEVMPPMSASRGFRLYRIDVRLGDLYRPGDSESDNDDLLSQYGRDGYYQQCMRLYIQHVASHMDEMAGELRQRLDGYTRRARKLLAGRNEGRLFEMMAQLLTGVDLMCDHLVRNSPILRESDPGYKQRLIAEAEQIIAQALLRHGGQIDDNRPEVRWLRTLRSLIDGGDVLIRERASYEMGVPVAGVCGMRDSDYYYLIGSAIQERIRERQRKAHDEDASSLTDILAALYKRGQLVAEVSADGTVRNYQPLVRFGSGKRSRFIKLPVWVVENREPPSAEGFAPAPDEKMPFDGPKQERFL